MAKKKVDYEALNSGLMRIPRLPVLVARGLIDIGISEVYELEGRAPEMLLSDIRLKYPDFDPRFLSVIRMAVYYAETPDADPSLLHPDCWN